MTVIVLLVIIAGLAIAVGATNAAVLRAWHEDRRYITGLADRLSADARLQAHTRQTLQDMRSAVRRGASGGPQ